MQQLFAEIFLPEQATSDKAFHQRSVRFVSFALVMLVWVPVFSVVFALLDATISALIIAVAGLAVVANLAVFRWTGALQGCSNVLTGTAWCVYTLVSCVEGGNGAPPSWWFATVPVLAITLLGYRTGAWWSVASIVAITGFYVAELTGTPLMRELGPSGYRFLEFTSLIGLTICLFALTSSFNRVEAQSLETLKRALEEAQAAARAKSDFLANMSHEIRTPMTAILGYTELAIEGSELGDPIHEELATIERNGKHLITVINDILDLSRIESGRMELQQIPSAPRQLVKDILELLTPQTLTKPVILCSRIDQEVPEWIVSDPTRLRQILFNLVGNAVKFTESGEVRIQLHWRDDGQDPPALECEVCDTGIGMSSDQLQRLFTPFSQADASTARRYGGTGLGLAISKRLAELMGGALTVKSELGRGSTFTVTVHAPRWNEERSAGGVSGAGNELASLCEELSGAKVLLAEDSADNQRLIGHMLRKAGCAVEVAENGEAAFIAATNAEERGEPFEVVLMDMQMPIVDGYTATRRLRTWGFQRPIIALTAHSMESDRQKCLDAGCDDYDMKPVERKRLFGVIVRNLRRHALNVSYSR